MRITFLNKKNDKQTKDDIHISPYTSEMYCQCIYMYLTNYNTQQTIIYTYYNKTNYNMCIICISMHIFGSVLEKQNDLIPTPNLSIAHNHFHIIMNT